MDHNWSYNYFFYNKFKSAIAYETTISELPSKTAVMASIQKVTETYEFEGDEKNTMQDMYQFMLASRLFNGLLEATTCEFSACSASSSSSHPGGADASTTACSAGAPPARSTPAAAARSRPATAAERPRMFSAGDTS